MHSAATGPRVPRARKAVSRSEARVATGPHAGAARTPPPRGYPANVGGGDGGEGRSGLPSYRWNGQFNPVRYLTIAWCGALLLLLLGGCAGGTEEESRIAETRAASKEAIVPEVQATNIVKEFFPPTPTPQPTPTPLPTLANLTLALQIGANNQPQNEVESVPAGSSVYAVAEIYHLSPGETVTAVWTTAGGNEISRSSVPVQNATDSAWVPFQWTAGGGGTFAVYVYVDDRLLNSLVFTVN